MKRAYETRAMKRIKLLLRESLSEQFSRCFLCLAANPRSSSLFATEERDRDGEMVGVEVVFVKTWNLRHDRIIIEPEKGVFGLGLEFVALISVQQRVLFTTKVKPEEEIINAIVLFARKQLLFPVRGDSFHNLSFFSFSFFKWFKVRKQISRTNNSQAIS